jgi:transketolase
MLETRETATASVVADNSVDDGVADRFAPLVAQAQRVREHIVRMSGRGGCFIGASLSCTDLLVYLYDQVLRVSPDTAADPGRDFLLLSKGHDVPALYGVLAERGWFDPARLDRHLDPRDHLYWHPNRHIPGVEFHSGSLGHLLSVGMGIALEARLAGTRSRVFVVLGDGELDEGSIWEGLLVAAAHKLDNLVLVIDRNEFQANIETERLIPLEPLGEKLTAFGASVRRTDGHSFPALERAFRDLPKATGTAGPPAVIAHTVRGKGLPSLERRADRWFVRFTSDEVTALLGELRGEAAATLHSETLVVR